MSKKKDKVIDPKRFYTLGEIVRERLIPGVTSVPIASRLVQSKQLDGTQVPRGFAGVQYKVRGDKIIEFLIQIDEKERI